MGRQQGQQDGDPVVTAIERVLRIERDGVEALRHAEDHAQRLLTEAREQAATIARRADSCIAKLHTAYLQGVQLKIQALAGSEALRGVTDFPHNRTALAEAARRVATKLTGGA